MKKALLLAAAALATFGAAGTASAQDETWTTSANVAFTSDYRFRGVTLSDNDFAVQGGFDLGHSSGFYVGTWASNIAPVGSPDADAETELDLYGGYGFTSGALSYDVGMIWYLYPGEGGVDYYELYGSVSGTAGSVDLTGGLAYVPDQDNTGDDNTYIYGDAGIPLGESPYSLGLHVGYEDGAFGNDKIDYSVSVGTTVAGLDTSLAYVGTDDDDLYGDGGFVFTVGAGF